MGSFGSLVFGGTSRWGWDCAGGLVRLGACSCALFGGILVCFLAAVGSGEVGVRAEALGFVGLRGVMVSWECALGNWVVHGIILVSGSMESIHGWHCDGVFLLATVVEIGLLESSCFFFLFLKYHGSAHDDKFRGR